MSSSICLCIVANNSFLKGSQSSETAFIAFSICCIESHNTCFICSPSSSIDSLILCRACANASFSTFARISSSARRSTLSITPGSCSKNSMEITSSLAKSCAASIANSLYFNNLVLSKTNFGSR